MEVSHGGFGGEVQLIFVLYTLPICQVSDNERGRNMKKLRKTIPVVMLSLALLISGCAQKGEPEKINTKDFSREIQAQSLSRERPPKISPMARCWAAPMACVPGRTALLH